MLLQVVLESFHILSFLKQNWAELITRFDLF